MTEPLLTVTNLKKHFPIHGGVLRRTVGHVFAVDGVSLTLNQGETLGIVGESGCGKSTLGRTIMRLYPPTAGTIDFQGQSIERYSRRDMLPLRRSMQMIFQDPYESLNPRHSIGDILEEPYVLHQPRLSHKERVERTEALLFKVGLKPEALSRYPHEFSGGQRQRIGIARAISQNPSLVICDEPVSALDVSIQAQVLNLLLDLQQELQLSYLFIAHDLSVVHHFSDRIAVMYLGKVVEMGSAEDVYRRPKHPYSKALIAAVPHIRQNAEHKIFAKLEGDLPSPSKPPKGCRFHTRCPFAVEMCKQVEPPLESKGDPRLLVACHRVNEIG